MPHCTPFSFRFQMFPLFSSFFPDFQHIFFIITCILSSFKQLFFYLFELCRIVSNVFVYFIQLLPILITHGIRQRSMRAWLFSYLLAAIKKGLVKVPSKFHYSSNPAGTPCEFLCLCAKKNRPFRCHCIQMNGLYSVFLLSQAQTLDQASVTVNILLL